MSAANPAITKTPRGENLHPAITKKPREGTFLSWLPVDEFFSLDLRSLAVFRIGLGIMLLQEWINRWVDLSAHYTDGGVLPRQLIPPYGGPLSLFMISGEPWYAATLMGLACFFAVLLILGWRTQLVTLISWFLLIGIQGRCFLILQGGDFVMRLMLFWGLFLPLGGCYSLDALRGPPDREWRPRVLLIGSFALIYQLAILYWFAALWKSHDVWRKELDAVYMSLSLEEFTSPLAHWLLNFPTLLKGLTAATIVLETFGPAFLFMPFAQGPCRFFVVVSFCLFHIGLSVCLALGNFPWICCVGWLALLPPWFWDQLEARLHSPVRAGLTIYYDGANSWHRKLVDAARMFLLLYETKAIPATTGEQHAGRLRDGGPWVVVDATGKLHVEYDALLCMVQASPLYWPLRYPMQWRPMRALGEGLLRWLAKRRPRSGDAAVDRSPYPGAQLGGLFQNALVIFFVLYVFVINLRTLDTSAHKTQFSKYFPESMMSLAVSMGLDQSWGLFAPYPGRECGWFLMPARLANGKIVDVYRDGASPEDLEPAAKPPTHEKPALMVDTYTNSRWRKLLMNLYYPQNARYRPYFCRWFYQEWNKTHSPEEQIVYFQFIFRTAQTNPDRPPENFHDDVIYWYSGYSSGSLAMSGGLFARPALLYIATRPLVPPRELVQAVGGGIPAVVNELVPRMMPLLEGESPPPPAMKPEDFPGMKFPEAPPGEKLQP